MAAAVSPNLESKGGAGGNQDTSELGEGENGKTGAQNGAKVLKSPTILSIYVLRREFHSLDGKNRERVGNEIGVSVNDTLRQDIRKSARGKTISGPVTGSGESPTPSVQSREGFHRFHGSE